METFVLRVWRPADDPSSCREEMLHGTIEHVATGEAGAFRVEDELVEFVRAQLRGGKDRPGEGCVSGDDR
jgi:hypothetical protein